MKIPPALLAVYAGRAVEPGDVAALAKAADRRPTDVDALSSAHAGLYAGDFDRRAADLQALREERDVLLMLDRQHEAGEIDSFRFDGRRYDSAEARRLLKQTDRLLQREEEWWADFDRRAFVVHYQMARDIDAKAARDLRSRYEFQLALQDIERECSRRRRVLARVASFVADDPGPLQYEDFHEVRAELLEAYDAFERCLRVAVRVPPPKLKCLPAGQPLANVLLSETPVKRLKPAAQTVSGRWIHKFGRQLDEVRRNAARVRSEALSALLARQAGLVHKWAEEVTKLPEAEAAEDEAPAESAAKRAARERTLLEPLDDETELEVVEKEEFVLSDRDVLPEPKKTGREAEVEEIDPDDHNERPRTWNV